jgi:hypothetical protein
MEDSYADNFSKLALAATSAQLAKSISVKDHGVGEDLTFNFMGWNSDELSIVCQMKKELMQIHPEDRLDRCVSLCSRLRQYWGVTAITMIAEGYCSMNPEKTHGVELAKAFAEPDSDVQECITLTHAEIFDINNIEVNLIALPYKYQVGREVEWLETLFYPTKAEEILRQSRYPVMLEKSLRNQVQEDAQPDDYDEIRKNIYAEGFYIQEFY